MASALALLALACRGAPTPAPAPTGPTPADSAAVVVAGPTLVGFFPPVGEARTAADEDLDTVLDDFGWHLGAATNSLRARGYQVEVRFTDTLHFRDGTRRWSFVPPDTGRIGYYLVAPGRAPHVLYQIHTDEELVELGAAYLRGTLDRGR